MEILFSFTRNCKSILTNLTFKDVCAHCYCASLVRTLFIGHARATSFSSAHTNSKTQENIERMTFALTWRANIFVGCSRTPTFFSADHFLFYLGCQRFFLRSFRCRSCLYCDPREKPLEQSAISLRAPSQWQASLNQPSPESGLES